MCQRNPVSTRTHTFRSGSPHRHLRFHYISQLFLLPVYQTIQSSWAVSASSSLSCSKPWAWPMPSVRLIVSTIDDENDAFPCIGLLLILSLLCLINSPYCQACCIKNCCFRWGRQRVYRRTRCLYRPRRKIECLGHWAKNGGFRKKQWGENHFHIDRRCWYCRLCRRCRSCFDSLARPQPILKCVPVPNQKSSHIVSAIEYPASCTVF